jgi:hypothetical protein
MAKDNLKHEPATDANVLLCARVTELEEELRVTDQLLNERQKVLDAIPECPIHGGNCVPHAIEWIAEMMSKHVA